MDVDETGALPVSLMPVDEQRLAELVAVATSAAAANEVTPPLTPGHDWTPTRVRWLEEYHRQRRGGLDGPAGEATWAVVAEGQVVGSVRLKALPGPGQLETGIWLARHVRGKGLGRQAIAAVLQHASAAGALEVLAETTSGNKAAQGLLSSLGFRLEAPDDVRVLGRIEIGEPAAP